jgi:hypothetical protein
MATLNLGDTHSNLVVINADGEGVPISYPLGNDKRTLVISLRLNLRFRLSEDFIYIDEEVFEAVLGDLRHIIGQFPICDGDSKQWLFKAGRYRVYGMNDLVMAASTELVTPHRSSIGTVQLIAASWVKEKER